MNKKYNVQLIIPLLYKRYDILLPINITRSEAILIIKKSINKLNKDTFNHDNNLFLYNSLNGEKYNLEQYVYDTSIKNGSILILC